MREREGKTLTFKKRKRRTYSCGTFQQSDPRGKGSRSCRKSSATSPWNRSRGRRGRLVSVFYCFEVEVSVERKHFARRRRRRHSRKPEKERKKKRTCLHAVPLPRAIVVLEGPELHLDGLRRRERGSRADERVLRVLRAVLRRRRGRGDDDDDGAVVEVAFCSTIQRVRRLPRKASFRRDFGPCTRKRVAYS